jgi:hypothetical protein
MVPVLVRLRSSHCNYADLPPRPDGQVGRPRRHEAKFACDDERTWWEPRAEHHEEHAQYRRVTSPSLLVVASLTTLAILDRR